MSSLYEWHARLSAAAPADLEFLAFVGFKCLTPFGSDRFGLHGPGIETRHNGAATAAHTVVGGGIDPLLKSEALLPYRHDGSLHLDNVIEERGLAEIAVDVDNHHTYLSPTELVAESSLEITCLGKVHKCQIDAVVEMPQHIDVIEPHLKRHMVAEMLYAAFTVIAHSLVGAYKAYRVIFYGDALTRIITLSVKNYLLYNIDTHPTVDGLYKLALDKAERR